jgi:hypothetical protein
MPVQDMSNPGRTVGTGVGVRIGSSFGGGGGGGGGGNVSASDKLLAKTAVKKNAKGGAIKKSGCEVKAYGDMIKKATGGKVQTSSDTARKLATEMGGMKKGGAPKKTGLAVMIAIGSPMKKPVRKAVGGPIVDAVKGFMKDAKDTGKRIQDRRDKRNTPWDELTKKPVKRAAGGVGKVRKGQAHTKKMDGGPIAGNDMATKLEMGQPSKFARGGAGKVRKGMMSPSGQILQAVKPKMK